LTRSLGLARKRGPIDANPSKDAVRQQFSEIFEFPRKLALLADRFLCVGRTNLERGDRVTEAPAPPPGQHFDDRLVFTVTEVAELLGVSRAFAYELAARGELPVLRLGRRVVVPKAALLALLSMAVER